jgi:hypothetical protein
MITFPKIAPRAEPLQYASPGTSNHPRRLQIFGVSSLVVGILSLLVAVYITKIAYDTRALGRMGISQGKHGAYWNEYADDDEFGSTTVATGSVLLGSSGLLVFAAILLLRSNRTGIPVHHFYPVIQILASIALAQSCMRYVFDSPGGPVYFLGAIPGVIGCIYPVIIFIRLPWSLG